MSSSVARVLPPFDPRSRGHHSRKLKVSLLFSKEICVQCSSSRPPTDVHAPRPETSTCVRVHCFFFHLRLGSDNGLGSRATWFWRLIERDLVYRHCALFQHSGWPGLHFSMTYIKNGAHTFVFRDMAKFMCLVLSSSCFLASGRLAWKKYNLVVGCVMRGYFTLPSHHWKGRHRKLS